MIPSRAALSPARCKIPKETCRPVQAFPSFLTRANSAVRVNREALGNLKRSRLPGGIELSLSMSGVMIFRSDWQQPLPTALTTSSESGPPAFGFHPGTKAVLTLSRALGRLIGSFHGNISWILGVGNDSRRVSDVMKRDRKSTRLNSSHTVISYAVFCLKKKKYTALALMKRNE